MADDIVAFLEAQFASEQRLGEQMPHFDPDGEAGYLACPATRTEPLGDLEFGEESCDCNMPARRARALAEVQAKRQILAIHGQAHRCPNHPESDVEPCRTVLLLATPFRGRPGWCSEWGVEA